MFTYHCCGGKWDKDACFPQRYIECWMYLWRFSVIWIMVIPKVPFNSNWTCLTFLKMFHLSPGSLLQLQLTLESHQDLQPVELLVLWELLRSHRCPHLTIIYVVKVWTVVKVPRKSLCAIFWETFFCPWHRPYCPNLFHPHLIQPPWLCCMKPSCVYVCLWWPLIESRLGENPLSIWQRSCLSLTGPTALLRVSSAFHSSQYFA